MAPKPRRKASKPRIGIDGTPIPTPRFYGGPKPIGPVESGSIFFEEIRKALAKGRNKSTRAFKQPAIKNATARGRPTRNRIKKGG